jgi:branched-subunit amino acid ABC-type transport system permease component
MFIVIAMNVIKILLGLSLLLNIAVYSTNIIAIQAQTGTDNAPATKSSVENVQTQTFNGRVTTKEGREIKVDNDGTVKSFNIPESVSITKDTFQSGLDKVNVGDTAKITYESSTNKVVSVEVTSGQIWDWGKIGIPAVILLLVLLALIYFFVQRSRRGAIKTAISDRPGSAS